MSKQYKINSRVYFNERLKQVSFHGKPTYPLYVQITFERMNIVFKSYYFELFSLPRYSLHAGAYLKRPALTEIIEAEKKVIDFIISKYRQNFSLDLFKEWYNYYSQDLCDITAPGFLTYLYTFFEDKGMPALATTLLQGAGSSVLNDVVNDMKIALNQSLYSELIKNSLYYAPPYLPLYGFMLQDRKRSLPLLSMMEWEETKTLFTGYIGNHFPQFEAGDITEQVEAWLKQQIKPIDGH